MAGGDGNNNDPLPDSQAVGVIVGTICLFVVISFVPMYSSPSPCSTKKRVPNHILPEC